MASKAERNHMHELMLYLTRKNAQIYYLQRRPMATAHISERMLRDVLDGGGNISMDCSEYCSLIPRLAGLKTPWVKDGWGNTQSIVAALPHYHDPALARVGALCVFNPYGPLGSQHVAIVKERGRDPLMSSHGSSRGPYDVRFSVENRYHGGSYVFCSVAHI